MQIWRRPSMTYRPGLTLNHIIIGSYRWIKFKINKNCVQEKTDGNQGNTAKTPMETLEKHEIQQNKKQRSTGIHIFSCKILKILSFTAKY